MRIREVHIKNFRAIDELHLEFTDLNGKALDLAVLAGPNGCGKTSAMEACLLALKKDVFLSRKPPAQDYQIEVEIESGTSRFKLWKTPNRHECRRLYGDTQTVFAFRELGCNVFYFSSWRSPKLVGSVGLSVGKGRRPAVSENNTLWRLKQKLVNITGSASFKKADGAATRSSHELFSRINDAWSMFYPEKNYTFDALAVTHLPKPGEQLEIEEEESFDVYLQSSGQSSIPIDELSSGEIEILSMLGMFIINSTPYNIVFIDEPELHLHPAWHRAILPALQKVSPGTQFICATHSQDILDSVYSFQRYTLLHEGDPRLGVGNGQSAVREVTE